MKRHFKRESKMKYSVIQYCIIGAICLPFLLWFGIKAEKDWHLSDALTIFIMCLIILAVWLAWIGIRSLIRRRSQRFIKERQESRQSINRK